MQTHRLGAVPAAEDVAGAAHNLTVKATDAFGNVVPSYTGTVQLSSSDSQTRGLPASFTFTPNDHGTHTFAGVILNTASTPGSPTQLSVEDTSHNLTGGIQVPVQSAAKTLSASGPKTAVAGQSFTITALALAGRKIDTQFPDTVRFSTSDSQAQAGLPGPTPFATADQGSKQFTITLFTAGRQTVTITDVTRGRITKAVFVIQVSPTGFGRLQVVGYPATTLLGAKHSFLVRAEDIYGNVVPGYTGTVDLASTDPASTALPASYTFIARDRGIHRFSVAFNTVGAWLLEATDSVNTGITGSLAVNAATLSAGITPPTGPIVRGQAVDFTLSASEDGATSATVFTWLVDWNGDGKVDQTFTGAPGQTSITIPHVFTAMGMDAVKVTVKDPSGNVSPQPATTTVQVVPVALQAEPGGATDLVVGGTTGKDTILIQPVNDPSGQTVSVSINGVVQSIGGQTAFSPTGHIVVYGQGGGDTISVQSSSISGQTVEVAIPAVLFSGGGNSSLSVAGSSAANVLVGASGNDKVTGGSGADILIGGAGKDVLQAGPGSDVLINGSTVYDGNLAALLALSAEWGSGQSYQARVQDLYYGGAGAANGSILLNSQAVNHDAHSISNQLFGSAGGLDWFWLAAATDKLNGEMVGEVVTLD
jgi:Ca2+-binding RTX toxin-like protein